MEPLQLDFSGFDTRFAPHPNAVKEGFARYLGRCRVKGCKHTIARDCQLYSRTYGGFTSTAPDTSALIGACPTHPKTRLQWDRVQGTVSDVHECDPRCTSARGPVCVCSCGGANHGAGWIVGEE